MVAGSDRSYLRSFGLSHNPAVFPLRVPRFSSPTHHFPTPSTCFSSLASLFFFFFTPYSPQIGPHRKRIATSRFSSVFPPFSLKRPIFALFLSNNAKSYLFSRTFLSKHLEGIKKTPYLCTRFSEQSTRRERESDKDKRSLKRFT